MCPTNGAGRYAGTQATSRRRYQRIAKNALCRGLDGGVICSGELDGIAPQVSPRIQRHQESFATLVDRELAYESPVLEVDKDFFAPARNDADLKNLHLVERKP